MNIKENKKLGYVVYGKPAKGCEYCVKGEKLVLFITGICSQRCKFCPVSEKKFGKDNIYANEWPIDKFDDILEEIRLTDAKGAGITGGDPLVKTERTAEFIKKLKRKFGKDFHTHLYTPFKLVDSKKLKMLYDAGLDEIRFHPKLDDNSEWKKIELARKYDWDIGLEIPCLPDKTDEIKTLVMYFHDKVKFLNLNELEFSDTKVSHYNLEGYGVRNDKSYAAKGSSEAARTIIKWTAAKKYNISVYFCSSMLKDRTQMGNRIKKRAGRAAKDYDIITEEGMLIRGCIYLKDLTPGFNYREKLKIYNKEKTVEILKDAKKKIISITKIDKIEVDSVKLRLTLSAKDVKKNKLKIKKLGFLPAIVEEYPTYDGIEIEVDMI